MSSRRPGRKNSLQARSFQKGHLPVDKNPLSLYDIAPAQTEWVGILASLGREKANSPVLCRLSCGSGRCNSSSSQRKVSRGLLAPLHGVEEKWLLEASYRPNPLELFYQEEVQDGDTTHDQSSNLTRRLACVYRPENAYFHVSIASEFQKYLCFAVDQIHLQFTCLPFGLTTLACVFSKLLLAVVALIRTRGIRLYHYLDDLCEGCFSLNSPCLVNAVLEGDFRCDSLY